jgi:sugar lactone lactonase YvrE
MSSVAVAPDGNIYVSDGYGNDRVVVFDKHGKFVRAWGRLGHGPGEFSQPHSLAVDSRGRVYVADRNNARVQVFDARGKSLSEWNNIVTPWYIVVGNNGDIWICGSSPMLWSEVTGAGLATPPKDQLLMRFDPDGRLKQLWAFPKGDRPGELNWVHGMALAAGGPGATPRSPARSGPSPPAARPPETSAPAS